MFLHLWKENWCLICKLQVVGSGDSEIGETTIDDLEEDTENEADLEVEGEPEQRVVVSMASPRFPEPTVTPSADVHHHRHHHGEVDGVQPTSTYSTPVLLTSPVPYGSIMPTPTYVCTRSCYMYLVDLYLFMWQ